MKMQKKNKKKNMGISIYTTKCMYSMNSAYSTNRPDINKVDMNSMFKM